MHTITFHLPSTVGPASDGTDYFYYLEISVAFCPPKIFQNCNPFPSLGSSEQSLCSSHKQLKSEWSSVSTPTQNPTATCCTLCEYTHVTLTRSQDGYVMIKQLKPLTLPQINHPEANFAATEVFGLKTCSVTPTPSIRNHSHASLNDGDTL
jgi:hypothetical protein